MQKYYIQDSTIGKYVYFNKINELISYFDTFIPRAFGINKKQYIQNLVDLGHNAEDPEGITLTQQIQENFNIGVVQNDGKHVRTDVHQASKYIKEEYGD